MSTPAYVALADDLERSISSLAPGSRVMSEHELVGAHGVSRLTARAALHELEERLLVRRVRGSGTFVVPRVDVVVCDGMPLSWARLVESAGLAPQLRLLSVRSRKATAVLRTKLDLDPDDKVLSVTALGSIGKVPAAHIVQHLPAELVGGLDDRLASTPLGAGPLDAILAQQYGLDLVRWWLRAESAQVPTEIAGQFGRSGKAPAWWLESCDGDDSLGRPVLLTQVWASADVHRISFEASRSR